MTRNIKNNYQNVPLRKDAKKKPPGCSTAVKKQGQVRLKRDKEEETKEGLVVSQRGFGCTQSAILDLVQAVFLDCRRW